MIAQVKICVDCDGSGEILFAGNTEDDDWYETCPGCRGIGHTIIVNTIGNTDS